MNDTIKAVYTIGPHTLTQDNGIFLFTMKNEQNVFNEVSYKQYNEMLDIVEKYVSFHTFLERIS